MPLQGARLHPDASSHHPGGAAGGGGGRAAGQRRRCLRLLQGACDRRPQELDAVQLLQPGRASGPAHEPVPHLVQGHHAADRPGQPAARGGVLREDVVQRQAEEEAQEHAGEVPAGAGERQEGSSQELRRTQPDSQRPQSMGGIEERGWRRGGEQGGTKLERQNGWRPASARHSWSSGLRRSNKEVVIGDDVT